MSSPLRLLLIEDSEDASVLIVSELTRYGFDVTARRVIQATEMRAALDEGNVDLIIADFVIPGFGALPALEIVRQRELDLPFLVVSASVGEETVAEALRAGAHDYLMKSNLTRLGHAVERELREAGVRAARRETEAALRESRERLLRAQRIGQIGSWEYDLRSRVLTWSPETYRLFGRSETDFVPTLETFFEAVHPDDRHRVRQAVERAMRNQRAYSIDHRIVLPDGSERVVHEQAEIQRDESGQPVRRAGTVQDVTERRRMEEQVRQSQKLDALGNLAGGLAHDFNNILTVILGYAELIATNPRVDEEIRDQIEQIAVSAERASKLTSQLLAFSRKRPMRLRPLDLNHLIRNAVPMLRRFLGENVIIDLKLEETLPWVDADSGLLEQALVNLTMNAREAMPHGGRLEIATWCGGPPPQNRPLESQPKSPFVGFSISDSGRGMDLETTARIFEPFFTTKEVGQGSGLGLATVYGIVQQHQGTIQVESRIGVGTTFRIYLPALAPVAVSTAPPSGPPSTTLPPGTETILLVEDEPSLRHLALNLLQRCGYRILPASSGPEALSIWKEHRNEIDLLLTDMVMPDGMTGGDLAKELLRQHPDLRVLYTTGYSAEAFQGDLDLREGVNFIAKPYSGVRLCQTVRACLDEEQKVRG